MIAPIDKEITHTDLADLIKKFDIQVLFYTNKTKNKVMPIVDDSMINLINIDEKYQQIIQEEYSVDSFFEDVKKVDKDKFSVLAFTSGTTRRA